MARPSTTVVVALMLIAGCASTPQNTVVTVPITRIATPPDELLAPIVRPPELIFVSPNDEKATSALTPSGEAALRRMIGQMLDRLEAWRVWSGVTTTEQ